MQAETTTETATQTKPAHANVWAVYLDGVLEATYASRRGAREHAAWLRRHPVVRDRRLFSDAGVVEVRDRRHRG